MRQLQKLSTRQVMSIFFCVEQANMLEMPENKFQLLIYNLENSPLFQRLHHEDKIIRHQPFHRTDFSFAYYNLEEKNLIAGSSVDIESLLQDKAAIVHQIQKLGVEKFKRYFLYPEPSMRVDKIAAECGLKLTQVQMINALVDDFSIRSEFYHPSSIIGGTIRYSKIANLERIGDDFIIEYFSPANARGAYIIDYERFKKSCKDKDFTKEEVDQARQLFQKLELINHRKNILFRILQNIVKKQLPYLKSGDAHDFIPYTQKELAKKIGIAPSTVSRAIYHRSVMTPWGEKPLDYFFFRQKKLNQEVIKRLIEAEKEPLTDEAMRVKLQESGLSISRRGVTSLRKELKIPVARLRRKNI